MSVVATPHRHIARTGQMMPPRVAFANLRALSGTLACCGRGSAACSLSARCAIAAERRPLPRRPRHLRGSSAAARLGRGRARRRRSGRHRASPTRSPISCASSGWANPRVVAARHPRPSRARGTVST